MKTCTQISDSGFRGKINVVSPGGRVGFSHVNARWNPALYVNTPQGQKRYLFLCIFQKLFSNSWGRQKANQYHVGDFIPDKTYWRQKEY